MIVDNKLYEKVVEIIATREVVLVPVPLTYSLHPKDTSICVIYVRDLQENNSYLISIDHPDACHCEVPTKIFRAYVPSIKDAVHLGINSESLTTALIFWLLVFVPSIKFSHAWSTDCITVCVYYPFVL